MPPGLFIYKKIVDQSVLREGFTIPVKRQGLFYENMNIILTQGERKRIKLLIDGRDFQAELINQTFDRTKYPTHKEMLQIRYQKNGALSKHLQAIFSASFSTISSVKSSADGQQKRQIKLPEHDCEYMAFYSTAFDDALSVDCITRNDISETGKLIRKFDEFEVEQLFQTDKTATIIEREHTVKIRKLDRTISENLKRLYGFKCQICGMFVGERYDTTIVHTHHIEYFSKSLNNDAKNIMVTCPNHHSIIHATNPRFNRKNLTFLYPNGLTEGLAVNMHL